MSDKSYSDDYAKFEAIYFIRSKIPYSPVFQQLLRKGNTECFYQQNLRVFQIPTPIQRISDSYPSLEQLHICAWRDRLLKSINTLAAGVVYSRLAFDLPSSKNVTMVEYATEWYWELQGRLLLSPATMKRYLDQVEANMAEMSSMSKSHAVMEEQASKKQEDQSKFLNFNLEYCNKQGDMEWHFRRWSYLTLPPPVQTLAATLPRTTAPLWHSSAFSQMNSLCVCSLCTRSAQALAGHLWQCASTPDSSYHTHWGTYQAHSGALFLVQGRQQAKLRVRYYHDARTLACARPMAYAGGLEERPQYCLMLKHTTAADDGGESATELALAMQHCGYIGTQRGKVYVLRLLAYILPAVSRESGRGPAGKIQAVTVRFEVPAGPPVGRPGEVELVGRGFWVPKPVGGYKSNNLLGTWKNRSLFPPNLNLATVLLSLTQMVLASESPAEGSLRTIGQVASEIHWAWNAASETHLYVKFKLCLSVPALRCTVTVTESTQVEFQNGIFHFALNATFSSG